jgi:pyridoxine 5-phosphate synthase
MPRLFLNVDHVATVRQARGSAYPDPVEAALVAESTGLVSGITAHLREDRRHVSDRDVREIRRLIRLPFNFEMSCAPEIVDVCLGVAPEQATLVPERREEITTEGGLDLVGGFDRVAGAVKKLRARAIIVSLFIDPDEKAVALSKRAGASHVELHTGRYCEAAPGGDRDREIAALREAALHAHALGLVVNAGHGLTAQNVGPVAGLPHVTDLNIGHAIVARSIFVGLPEALREMAAAIKNAGAQRLVP